MEFLNAFTFAHGEKRGFTAGDEWKRSLDELTAATGCDTLLLPVAARQEHAYSTQVDDDAPDVMSHEDARAVCAYARQKGMKLILKAMVNCRDGYWRAYIRFFDSYVPTEPTWEEWFQSYQAYVWRLAELAQEVRAELFCVGCEMVGTDHRDAEWRRLIAGVRQRYDGPITYNCDKFQEGNVSWWDALDVISSSGYYPLSQLAQHFERIRAVCEKWQRPFLFMECGCPSRHGSEAVPNNWSFGGEQDNDAQRRWYDAFTRQVLSQPWVRGVGWWDWSATRLYPREQGATDRGYNVYGKPAEAVVRAFSKALRERAEKGPDKA